MELFLEIGLSNAVVALGLALLAFCAGRMFRRPAVTHGLWLLVLIKLVTPPLAWIPVSVLGAANALLFKKTGRLSGAVALHLVYNAVVLS